MKNKNLVVGSSNEAHSLETVRSDINSLLDKHYKKQIEQATKLADEYGYLWKSLSAQHIAGGKRFRPYLCVLTYEAFGGKDYKSILPICAALELLHSALLIHDDIIDQDDTRRGRPNVFGTFIDHYRKLAPDSLETDHLASGAALIGGDLLISDAYQMIIGSNIAADYRLKAMELLGQAIYSVAAGELLDSEAPLYEVERADSIKIAQLKTASYSCSNPLIIGAMLAGASAREQQKLNEIGNHIGVAFQLADDMLSLFGNESTGKVNLSDIREGKGTFILQQTLELANKEQKRTLENIIGNPNYSEQMATTVKQIAVESGAKNKVESVMSSYIEKTEVLIDALQIDNSNKQLLKAFAKQAVWRDS